MFRCSFSRTFSVFIFLLLIGSRGQAQQKDYQGLMWEISGNGLKKPSYLYGTMHVSSKLAFHLSDSFYLAIQACDMVALEQNLDSVVDKWINPQRNQKESYFYNNSMGEAQGKDMLRLVRPGNDDIAGALSRDPAEINGVMFRYSFNNENFEEDTYLDLYIYKVGKKLKKKVAGVEQYDEVNELVEKAGNEPLGNKNKKKKKYIPGYTLSKLFQDAYRKGDLFIIDSLDRLVHTEHYLEYMLYKRNENMVRAMDSIMKQSALFTGVGASHLPGERGVINLLRQMGYTLRPIPNDITEVHPKRKEKIDAIYYPLQYKTQYPADSAFRVDVPGELIETSVGSRFIKYLTPELVNGAYFTVTRVKTYTSLKNQSPEDILKVVDTLLYENIPGRIIRKTKIRIDGYPGYEVLNRTKKGDYQRYYIISSPIELFVFKLGGHGDMARSRDGNKFFSSIHFIRNRRSEWFDLKPVDSTLSVQLPVFPTHNMRGIRHPANSERVDYIATDESSGITYIIQRRELYNVSYLEEDTFELNLMAEGFASGGNFKQLSRKHFSWNGYPALDVKYEMPGNKIAISRFVIRGTRFEMFAEVNPKEQDYSSRFFKSISFSKPVYRNFTEYRDTALYYSVSTPCLPGKLNDRSQNDNPGDEEFTDHLSREKSVCFVPENKGEVLRVSFFKYHKYYSVKDSAKYWIDVEESIANKNLHIDRKNFRRNGMNQIAEFWLSDTNTIRKARVMVVLRQGVLYHISANYDAIGGESEFITRFFSSFKPMDTLIGTNIFRSQGAEYLADISSGDSLVRDKALKSISWVIFNPEHASQLAKAIDNFYMDKNYLKYKSDLIREMGYIKTDSVVSYLRNFYLKAADTTSLQMAVLNALSNRQSEKSFAALKELIALETPIPSDNYEISQLFNSIHDTLKLAARLYPEILGLTSIDEYEDNVYYLMNRLLDSNLIRQDVFKNNINYLLTQAKVELKRHMAEEEKHKYSVNYDLYRLCATLIYYKQNPAVMKFMERLESVQSRDMKFSLSILKLKNGLPVADSVFENFAANNYYRLKLYRELKEIKRSDRFPKKWLQQEAFAMGLFAEGRGNYNRNDTFAYMGRSFVKFRNDSGYVYLFKYRNKEKDEWSVGLSGLLPADSNQVTDLSSFSSAGTLYNESLAVEEILAREISETSYRKRRSMNNSDYSYYATNGYSGYSNYDYYDEDDYDYDY